MAAASYILSFLLFLAFSGVVLSETCVYTISVRTGGLSDSGTDANVSLKISNMEDPAIEIPNLVEYGIMEDGHNYFETNNLDLFSYSGPCYTVPVCYIKLSQDDSGDKPGWYVDYVQIITSGGSGTPSKMHFGVAQWLADDEAPYKTYANVDKCDNLRKTIGGIQSAVDGAI